MDVVHRSFPPIANADIRVLILGSMPGARSLELGQYYAHPRNQLWRIMAAITGRDMVTLSYDERCAALLDHGIGLWDVFQSCTRNGSLDTAIRNARPNDLMAFVSAHQHLRIIGFNGGKAAKSGRAVLPETTARIIDLPSSSPAYTLPLAAKIDSWLPIRDALVR
ncbi:DNA-deoxyinosine glycosylase [Pacificimonas sp. WHA3]|uniref:DNA-deoxyinosine glycosylase n=1 Tax=Pacificimonas pallii TaxID=2827236 RepID=A0ABS6SGK9_9SPHN|nr:DNA-deoxyinosine glycosylase [Pacificimonas pallii]MBV7257555.1 DNA-deoxyinosine glycosylase [Pacificimonas pallii]